MFCWRAGRVSPWPEFATRVLEIRMGGVFGRWCGAAWLVASALLVSLAGCDNSPWERGAAGQNTLFTAMQEGSPRHMDSVGVVLVERHHVHVPDLRAALRLPLPQAPVRADRQGRPRRSPSRATSTRTASSCPRTRRASRSPRASTTSTSSAASCSSRIRRSPRTPMATTCTTDEAGRARQAAPRRCDFAAAGHARAGRRRLRLRAQAPRHARASRRRSTASSPST